MKKLAVISASTLFYAVALVSCTSSKLAVNTFDDNLYFMSADVKKATQNAVANNQPGTFQTLAEAKVVPQESFSTKNVNPEYLSRYGQINTSDEDVIYFEENQVSNTTEAPNIDVYNSFRISNFNSGWGNTAFNYGFSPFGMGMNPFGMGMMGVSPFGMGMIDPFWGPNWGWRPGFNVGLSLGWGRPFYTPMNPYLGWGGFYDPFWGGNNWGSPWSWGRPIYATGPIIILSGSENGNRRVVYGARPSRGASMNGGNRGIAQSIGNPNTARAQARETVANSRGASPRRLGASESSRTASRDFSNSQNDYYSSGRSRMATSQRNVNSPASARSAITPNRTTSQSATRNSSATTSGRGYTASPSRSAYSSGGAMSRPTSTSPSYNRSSSVNTGSRFSTSGRSSSSAFSSGGSTRSSSSSFSAPSRSSSGAGASTSRSSSGSSGSTSSGGSRGRGN